MDHLLRQRPPFIQIVEKQRAADHRLNHDKTTRTEPELAHYRRMLAAVPLNDVELPKLPLGRPKDDASHFILLGEIAQQPGTVVVFDIKNTSVSIMQADELELVPPDHV